MFDNVCSKEVSLLCLIKLVASVLFWCWKKKRYQNKLDLTVSIVLVSSNNETEVPPKRRPRLGKRSFLLCQWTEIALRKIFRFQSHFYSFQNNFFYGSPRLGYLNLSGLLFPFIQICKSWFWKNISSFIRSGKQNIQYAFLQHCFFDWWGFKVFLRCLAEKLYFAAF